MIKISGLPEVCLLQKRGRKEKYLYSCDIESIKKNKVGLKVGWNYLPSVNFLKASTHKYLRRSRILYDLDLSPAVAQTGHPRKILRAMHTCNGISPKHILQSAAY